MGTIILAMACCLDGPSRARMRAMIMQLRRRSLLHLFAGAAVVPAMRCIAFAQAYPARPVHVVIGVPAGGQIDIVGRLITQWLSDRLGQTFAVDNRPGATGNLATETVVRAPADGYTLLICTTANAINATFYETLSFNFIRDIAPIAAIARFPSVLVVHPSFQAKTLRELIDYAAANPGKINIATTQKGSAPDMAAELFKMMSGVDAVIVPYRGDPPMLTDMLAGRIQVAVGGISFYIQQIRTGQLRALGVTTASRLPVLPDVPAIAEAVPGYATSGWLGLGAPSGTPPEIIATLNHNVNLTLADATLQARLADIGVEASAMSPDEYGAFIADETARWAKVVHFAGMKAE